MQNNIDFIITWVDDNDSEWQKEKEKYLVKDNTDNRDRRYRDWDNLKYWFRGVEKFAPWVKKVHFVTWGHFPEWLNLEHPKLNIVKHEEYIPKEFLPTFSNRPIELNLHRIPGLADKFVYFNDDMFILKPIKESDFFRNNFPCDTAVLNALYFSRQQKTNICFAAAVFNMCIINDHFNKNESLIKNIHKWINPRYGLQWIRTILLLPWDKFTGFMNYHLPYSYMKETFNKLWELEHSALSKTCSNKFRQNDDINSWIFSYWQLASGKFYPRNPNIGKAYNLVSNHEQNKKIYSVISKQKYKLICLNDSVDDDSYVIIKEIINNSFQEILPEKSSFEK